MAVRRAADSKAGGLESAEEKGGGGREVKEGLFLLVIAAAAGSPLSPHSSHSLSLALPAFVGRLCFFRVVRAPSPPRLALWTLLLS